jgi:hypothetical protein
VCAEILKALWCLGEQLTDLIALRKLRSNIKKELLAWKFLAADHQILWLQHMKIAPSSIPTSGQWW